MIHLGDITKIKGYEAPTVDCIIGGSPCQDLSLAGKRAGLAGARSGLYMEQIRIIKEMREYDRANGRTGVDIRPRYMVWENVPGAFSTNKGEDFAAVLEEAIRVAEPEAPSVPVPEKGWPTAGCIVGGQWSVAWRVLDAQFWGTSDKPLPQRRRRIALVADFGGLSAPEILFVRQSVSGDIEPGKPKGKETARDAGESSGGAVPYTVKIRSDCEGGGKGALVQTDKSATLSTLQDQTLFQPVYGFDPQACRDVGQYVVENMANTLTNGTNPGWHSGVCYSIDQGGCKSGASHYEDISPTLTCTHDGAPAVSYCIEMTSTQNTIITDGICPTLTARMGTGGNQVNAVMESVGYEMQAFGKHKDSGIASSLKARDHKDATDLVVEGVDCRNATEIPGQNITLQSSACHNLNSGNVVRVKHIVRRLTPLECERLQGFPDGWTDIGEWVDTKGKKHKEADSPRYKALGNSIAIPPWKWVLKRLCACYERDATMASLFDGIGGFPYIWEQINGKGSCLWASEIEEFPIAVTKLRFGGWTGWTCEPLFDKFKTETKEDAKSLWIDCGDFKCPVCGGVSEYATKHCPDCGAKLIDGGADNG